MGQPAANVATRAPASRSSARRAPGVRLSNPRQLTFTTGVESFPSWSPDRGRIAYVSDQSGNNDIWVVPSDGGGAPALLTPDAGSPAVLG